MGKIKNFFTDDDNLKAIMFGLMVGASLTASTAVAALIEFEWSGTRAIADFFGFENIKQVVAVYLALAFMSAVSYWMECHRVEHKCIMRLIELQNEKIDCYSRHVDKLTSALLMAIKQHVETTKTEEKENEK
jgi:hypothetical protein